jgi:Fic-DOC domain mobile mystery protein B
MDFFEPIPGETPIDDISGLKFKDVRTRAELNVVEIANITRAIAKYLGKKITARTAPFDYSWCLKLHKEMFGDVWKWAGKPRKSNKNIGVDWQQIEPQLFTLMDNLKFWAENKTLGVVEQSAHLHFRAVQIHPFENGNGRWSRLLANIWLHRNRHPITLWPEETIGSKGKLRDEYIAAVQTADEGDMEPLLALHRKFTKEEPSDQEGPNHQRRGP